MRLIQKILLCSFVFTTLSCGDDNGEMETTDNPITEITISSNKLTVKPTGTDRVILTVVDQDGKDISDNNGVIYFNYQYQIRRSFTMIGEAILKIHAKKDSIKSNELEIISEVGEVTTLNIQTNKSSIPANGFSRITLSAIDQDQDMIAKFVDFYANDQKLESRYFYTRSVGTVEFKARYKEVESNSVSVQVTTDNSKGRKVVIEEFTGEWCGWCPPAGYNLGLLDSISDVVILTAIHGGDRYAYRHVNTLSSKLRVYGYPGAVVNRRRIPQGAAIQTPTIEHPSFIPIIHQIESILEETTQLGIAVATKLSGSEVTITPKFKFYESISNPVRYTIYINENKLNGRGQANYYYRQGGFQQSIFYYKPNPLTDYEHDHVLRKNATDALGELIPSNYTVANGVYEPSPVVVDLSGYVIENCEIIVFAHNDINGENKSILNAQKVAPGESIDYTGLPFK